MINHIFNLTLYFRTIFSVRKFIEGREFIVKGTQRAKGMELIQLNRPAAFNKKHMIVKRILNLFIKPKIAEFTGSEAGEPV